MQTTTSQNRPATKDLSTRIRSEWSGLTDEEIGYATRDRERFYDVVKRKHGLTREQVAARLAEWENKSREAA